MTGERLERLALQVLAELRAIRERLDAQALRPDVVVTREEAARQLKVSVRQLQRLIAGGRINKLPSGIAWAELERYAATPQLPASVPMSRPTSVRSAKQEADRLRAMLRTGRPKVHR